MNASITSTYSFSKPKSFSFGSHQSFPLRYGWIEKFCIGIIEKRGYDTFEKEDLRPEILSQQYGLGNNNITSILVAESEQKEKIEILFEKCSS